MEREHLVAESLSDFQDRLARGERPDAEDYSESLGDAFSEFVEVLEVERELNTVLEPLPEGSLPREFGRYTLLRELGRGAVGIVYEAEHRELGRKQAVKVLRAGFEESADALERFHREAKALASIDHPHIVKIYDAGEVDGRAYYAMALVEGRTLAALVRTEGPQDARWACRGLAGVADALQALHEEGIFHRDVKPSNIMIDADDRMVLADFGLARSVGSASLTRSGQALGTPLYMSPEQMMGRNDEVDGRSDVYGLGATLYELISGRRIFDATDVRVLLHKVLNEQPEDVRRVRPDLPAGCARIVRMTLEKKQSDRYASAAALEEDLLAFAEGRRVVGRPVSPARRFLRRSRAFALPIAALLLAGLGIFLWLGNRPGTLIAESMPNAMLTVDGEAVGQIGRAPIAAPLQREFPPGTYHIVIEREHFLTHEETVTIPPGQDYRLTGALVPERADSPQALQILRGEWLAITNQLALTRVGTTRAATRFDGTYLLPTGTVRIEDLERCWIQADMNAPDDGFLAFWKVTNGERGELLHRAPLSLQDLVGTEPLEVAFPSTLRERLAPGDVVEWGYVDDRDRGTTTRIRAAALSEAAESALARISTETAHLAPVSRAWLEARVLMEYEVPMSAWLVLNVVAIDPAADGASLLPWAYLREALVALDLEATPWYAEADAAVKAFPSDERARVYAD